MGKRGKVRNKPGHYVVRDRFGKFKSWVSIPRSIRMDATRRAKTKVSKPGYGHLGDYKRKSMNRRGKS